MMHHFHALLLLLVFTLSACDSAPTTPAQAPSLGAHEQGHEESGHGEEGEHEEGVVSLSPAAAERGRVALAPVRRASLERALEAPAEVQFDVSRVVHVSPLVEGQITRVSAELGEEVEKGEPLVTIKSVALADARSELRQAQAGLDVAQENAARQQRLREEGIAAERSLHEARGELRQARARREAALARLEVLGARRSGTSSVTLRSPISGTVVARHATRGESVGPQDILFTVADLSRVWVVGRVYEQHLARVARGNRAVVTVRAYPGDSWEGPITYIGSELDEATRSVEARVELDNPDHRLKPGLFATLTIDAAAAPAAPPVPTVPEDAVLPWRGRQVVFVPQGEPYTYRAVPVTLGARQGGRVEVLAGLEEHERVVVSGAFMLKSELLRGELGEGHAH